MPASQTPITGGSFYVGLGVTSFGSGDTGHLHSAGDGTLDPESGTVSCDLCYRFFAPEVRTVEFVTVNLSAGMEYQLSKLAEASHRSLEDVAAEYLARGLGV